jgi:NTE family protein
MDGGLADPLPYDRLTTRTDLVIAIDVSGAGRAPGTSPVPGAIEALASASQILQRSIVREKLRSSSPDILIEMPSPGAGVLEFHRWREILEAAEPAREQLKRQIARVLSAQNAEVTGSQQAAGQAP